MRFDIICGNPPYNNNLDLKFVDKCLDLLKPDGEMVVVHPSISTITRKPTKKYKEHKDLLDGKVKSIKLFNGNPVFNIGLFYPCQIIHIVPGEQHDKIDVTYSLGGDEYTHQFDSIYDINKWGNIPEYFSLEKKILDYCLTSSSCDDKLVGTDGVYSSRQKVGNYFVNLAGIRGNMVTDTMMDKDFYTMPTRDLVVGNYFVNLAGIRGHVATDTMMDKDFYTMPTRDLVVEEKPTKTIWVGFETKVEADNFLSYLKTDFARFALSIFKFNANLHRGELKSVPFFPSYITEWTKDRITEELNLTEEEWLFIEKVIPKYY